MGRHILLFETHAKAKLNGEFWGGFGFEADETDRKNISAPSFSRVGKRQLRNFLLHPAVFCSRLFFIHPPSDFFREVKRPLCGAPQIYGKKKRKKLLGRKPKSPFFRVPMRVRGFGAGWRGLEEVDFVRFLFGKQPNRTFTKTGRTELFTEPNREKKCRTEPPPNRTKRAKKTTEPNRT